MIHHERLRPPPHDYPADEWNLIEKRYHPEFKSQLETMLALGNGYLGTRGCPEEVARTLKTAPSSMGSTRPDRSYTEKRLTASRRPGRPSLM